MPLLWPMSRHRGWRRFVNIHVDFADAIAHERLERQVHRLGDAVTFHHLQRRLDLDMNVAVNDIRADVFRVKIVDAFHAGHGTCRSF